MPSLGADMVAGTLVEWRVQPGDEVERGDIVAVVDTEKSAIEVEVYQSGVVDELLVDEGAHVPVGTPLARIRSAAAAPTPSATAAAEPAVAQPATTDTAPAPAVPPAVPARAGRRGEPHSPLVRRLARTHGIDLSTMTGSGPGGAVTRHDIDDAIGVHRRPRSSPYARRVAAELDVDVRGLRGSGVDGMIVAADVEAAARSAAGKPRAEASPRDRLAAQQHATAVLMTRSKREIPHYHLQTDIDLTGATAWLEEHNHERPIKTRVLPAALLLKAVATAARDVPDVNGHWTDGAFRPSSQVRLGVAISLRGGGLIAPAITDADQRSVDELMASLRELISAARAGTLRSSQMVDPTITVTNLGDRGAKAVFGVIYPPQVALVGFGRISERPWTTGGTVGARVGVTATLAGDHRVSDGHRGSRYLATIDRLLQEPDRL